jgi:hypothetical protein
LLGKDKVDGYPTDQLPDLATVVRVMAIDEGVFLDINV